MKCVGMLAVLLGSSTLLLPGAVIPAQAFDPCLNAFPLAYVSESLRIAESELRPADWIWFSDVAHNDVRYLAMSYSAGQAEIEVRSADCSQVLGRSVFAWVGGETNAWLINAPAGVDLSAGEYRVGVHVSPGCAFGSTATQPPCWAENPITTPPTGNYRLAVLATWRL